MRGCLLFVVGLLVGAGLLLFWSPRVPHGVTAPSTSDVLVRLSNSYLAHAVESKMSGSSVPSVSNVQVSSNPPSSLSLHADLSIGPVSAPVAVELEPQTNNGKVDVHLVSSQLAGIPLPPQILAVVTDAINSRIAAVPGNGGRVVGIRVLPSGLEILIDYA